MSHPSPLSDEERADLVAYLDGELDGAAAAALEARIQQDPGVRAEAEAFRKTWQLLDYLPRPQPTLQFTQQTLERVAAERPRVAGRSVALGVGWAAAVVIAGVVGFAGGRRLPRSAEPALPFDVDCALVKDLGVIENQRLYEHADGLDFLRALADPADPDLFGGDNLGS